MQALFETYVPFFVLNLDELGGKVTNKHCAIFSHQFMESL